MDKRQELNILQVSAMDNYGGAARVAWDLHAAYRKSGHPSRMFVGQKFSIDPDIALIPDVPPSSFRKFLYQFGVGINKYKIELGHKNLGRFFQRLSKTDPVRSWNTYCGVEDFEYPGTWKLLDALQVEKPDIVHLHNLHANYFDLRILPSLSSLYPVLLGGFH